jgi:RNA-directed DNA polymerase
MKDGVGQLALTFCLPAEPPEREQKDAAQETQDNGSEASIQSGVVESKPARKRKWHSLIDKVYALPNLQFAWERVRANEGASGIDGMTIKKFAENAEQRLQQLSQDLRAKTYRPQPVRRVFIPKSGGGQRPLGIPTVRDRIVQQALLQILGPIFEAKFSNRSHGFRPERGCHTALEVVDRAVRHGYGWVVDADLQSFFDTVDHEKLLDTLNEEIADGSVLKLIRRILEAGVLLPGVADTEPTELGTPQGGPLSPLLANVYLHAFDEAMTRAGYGLVRYADDFVIFAKSESEAVAALELARTVLGGSLGLRLHPEKTRVVSVAEGFEFLGFHYFADPKRGTLRKEVRRKSVRRFRERLRELTPRLKNQRLPKERHITPRRLAKNKRLTEIIRGVNRYLEGWHGHFQGIWSYRSYFQESDQFIRRRLRTAITGRIGSGWWHQRLPNRLLAELGLVSLQELNAPYRQDPWEPGRTLARKG